MSVENLSDQQLEALLAQKRAVDAQMEANMPSERLRTVAQGATLGHADEVEAFVRSAFSDRQYDDIRDEIRNKLYLYKNQNPKEALTYEIAGALVPTVLAIASGAGAGAAPVTLSRVAGMSALQGAGAGLGYSEAKDPLGMTIDTGVGTAIGGVAGPAAHLALQGTGGLASRFIAFARERFGNRASTAVQNEIQRLAAETGKSIDEIISDVADGRLMAENKTLVNTLKAYVNEGGEAANYIVDQSQGRARETAGQAMGALRQELTPGMTPNIVRGMRQSEDAMRSQENELFGRVFDMYPEVNQDIATNLVSVVQRMPDVGDYLDSVYLSRGIVPLFTRTESGAIEFARAPSLEDAEIVRRAIDEKVTAAYKGGQGTYGEGLKPLAQNLRDSIDSFAPEMALTRAQSSQNFDVKRGFDLGRKALTANVDEMELVIEKFADKPEVISAIRAGFMDSITQKVRKQKTTFANLIDEDRQLGAMMRTLLTGKDITNLERRLSVAADTQEIASKLPQTAGSPTQGLQRAEERMGSGVKFSDVLRTGMSDPTVAIDLLDRLIRSKAPKFTDAQRMQIVSTLYERDPAAVRAALVDETALTNLINQVTRLVGVIEPVAVRGATEQATQFVTDQRGQR